MKADARTFRIFIILAYALAVIGPLWDLFLPDLIPKLFLDARETYESSQEWSLSRIIVMLISALAGIIVATVATIGLYIFKSWGRTMSLWFTLAAPLFYPFLGPTLESGWATACNSASSTIWGVVLSMAYFSELKSHFEQVKELPIR